jgi:hypothetical protein
MTFPVTRQKDYRHVSPFGGNEVLECSLVTGKSLAETAETPRAVHPMDEIGKSLAEIAEIPGEYFARETVSSFTVSLRGAGSG